MKPFRDWPSLAAGFAALAVGLGGICFDRYVLGTSGIWPAWVFLVTVGLLVLTGIDVRSLLGSLNNRKKD